MVIEHSFVTTMEGPQAMLAASNFLSRRGFEAINTNGVPVGAEEWSSLQMTRGRKNARRAKSVVELPQLLRLDFDRGRVTVAASITPNAIWGGGNVNLGFGVSTNSTYSAKKMKLHTDMMMGIVRGLEILLAQKAPAETASQEWDRAEAAAILAMKKRRRNQWIMVGILFAVVFLAVFLIVANAPRR